MADTCMRNCSNTVVARLSLPKEFRLPGKEVRVRRVGRGILLEPIETDLQAWFDRLDSYRDVPFMPEGGQQLPMPPSDDVSFDE